MSPEGAVANPFSTGDDPQNSNSFGGAGAANDIPPEYANDPELWQAIQLSMMDSAQPSNPQNDQTAFEALDLTN